MEDSAKLKLGLGVVLALLVSAFFVSTGFPTGMFLGVDESDASGASTTTPANPVDSGTTTTVPRILTFIDNGGAVETKDGKPVIRLFSTTWCGHCGWIEDAYDETVMEYVKRGEIVAYHWQLDTDDDSLRDEKVPVPQSEIELYRRFNPRGTIPTFIFGSKYYRVGNGYEREGDLEAEKAEFRAVIDELIRQSQELSG